jgi:phosphoadenosine phosphosulfate reductase
LTASDVADLDAQFDQQETTEVLAWAWKQFGARAAIGTSFQGAGLVMMHLAKTARVSFPIFTLDTGLLFPETLELKKKLEDFYGWEIESINPDQTLAEQADSHGPALWSRDPDLCCTMRKVLPLQSKLRDLDCWLTGLRRQQTSERSKIGVIELYARNDAESSDMIKLNPMANWSREAVWDYIRQHQIPFNPLHTQGYHSIGCMTCTRKTGEGEDERAGRWTGFKKLECGIHTFMSRKNDFQI